MPRCTQLILDKLANEQGKEPKHTGYGQSKTDKGVPKSIDISNTPGNYDKRVSLCSVNMNTHCIEPLFGRPTTDPLKAKDLDAVSYTHLRAHET